MIIAKFTCFVLLPLFEENGDNFESRETTYFGDRIILRNGTQMHTGESPFTCDACTQLFVDNDHEPVVQRVNVTFYNYVILKSLFMKIHAYLFIQFKKCEMYRNHNNFIISVRKT